MAFPTSLNDGRGGGLVEIGGAAGIGVVTGGIGTADGRGPNHLLSKSTHLTGLFPHHAYGLIQGVFFANGSGPVNRPSAGSYQRAELSYQFNPCIISNSKPLYLSGCTEAVFPIFA
ncbi:MAG: hypothetical protein FWF54_10290 [Candidatus Azobacteroides sp.]|nr:hypothetical protein [Candidatus Azobacteroides sp.]